MLGLRVAIKLPSIGNRLSSLERCLKLVLLASVAETTENEIRFNAVLRETGKVILNRVFERKRKTAKCREKGLSGRRIYQNVVDIVLCLDS